MKQFYFITCALFFLNLPLGAQVTSVVEGQGFPYALLLNGNELYFSDLEGNKISKIDITISSPSAVDVITGLNGPVGIAFKGNELYIAENSGGKISKIIDISATTLVKTDLVTNLNKPTNLAFKDNELYYSLDVDGKISKIQDVTATTLTVIDLVTGLTNPVGIVFRGNELYITEPKNNTIEDKIYKIDITDINPTLTEVITGVSGPRGVVFNDGVLYFVESSAGKVSKLDVSTLNTIEFNDANENIKIFPNPTVNSFQLSGLKNLENYKVYNVLGKKVLEGIISESKNINVKNLTKGLFFLKLENGIVFKFIKK